MTQQNNIPVPDILEESEGMLKKQLYVIFTETTSGMGPVMENLDEHLEYQRKLEEEGIMFAAGPFWTDDEQYWDGDGMVVVRAESIQDARNIAENDPMHQSGARDFTVRPWLMNEGTMDLKINFSNGDYSLE